MVERAGGAERTEDVEVAGASGRRSGSGSDDGGTAAMLVGRSREGGGDAGGVDKGDWSVSGIDALDALLIRSHRS